MDMNMLFVCKICSGISYCIFTSFYEIYSTASVDRDQTDFFPSLTVRHSFSDNLIGRFALTRSISRPEFSQIVPRRDDDDVHARRDRAQPPHQAQAVLTGQVDVDDEDIGVGGLAVLVAGGDVFFGILMFAFGITNAVLVARTDYGFSPRRFVSALMQYSSSTHVLSSNFRFRWEYRPGSELFVVYTDDYNTAELRPDVTSLRNRALVIKLNRLFRP